MRSAIAILALAVAWPAQAAPPKLIQGYRLEGLPPPPSGFYRTVSFALSPDEQWIAVVVSTTRKDTINAKVWALDSTLLLLPVHPSSGQRVQISPAMRTGKPLWSPDSKAVAVQAAVANRQEWNTGTSVIKAYNLRGELLWTGPSSGGMAGFIDPGHLLVRHRQRNHKPAGFDTINVRTSAVTPWPVPRHWMFAAMNPDRRLVAMFPDSEKTKTVIVDYATGKVLQSMKNQVSDLYWYGPMFVHFAEHGKAVCFAALDAQSFSVRFSNYPICRDVDTGRTIAELKTVDGGEPADASSAGTRVVLTNLNGFPGASRTEAESRSKADAISGPGLQTYSGNVVWDVRSGEEIAAWKPGDLRLALLGQPLAGTVPTVAISSSGKYVVMGFGDEVRVYELP